MKVMMTRCRRPQIVDDTSGSEKIMLLNASLAVAGPFCFKETTGIKPEVTSLGATIATGLANRFIVVGVVGEANMDGSVSRGVSFLAEVLRGSGVQALVETTPNISCRLRPWPPRTWEAERAGDTDRVASAAGAPKHPSLPPKEVRGMALRGHRSKARGRTQCLEAEVGAREELAVDALSTSACPRDQRVWPSVEGGTSPPRLAAHAGPDLWPVLDGPGHGHRDLLDGNLHRRDLVMTNPSDMPSSAMMPDLASHLPSQCIGTRIPRPIFEVENVNSSLPGTVSLYFEKSKAVAIGTLVQLALHDAPQICVPALRRTEPERNLVDNTFQGISAIAEVHAIGASHFQE